ncbi:MAG TPA: T9SS type A sorting domain-containing protein [Ignavibacteriaceae bacterium]|nr:T9SS type A sorting domain-containing protein [Ignavibacteriaceae bacterium]
MKIITTPLLIKSILLLLTFFTINLSAQAPPTMWTKTFGGSNIDIGHSVEQTSDGGFIITGYTRSYGTMSGRNVWLIKTDESGNMEWENTFGGNSDDEGHSVKQTSDGGYILAGLTDSYGAGLKDFYLVKTDSVGTLQWERTFGGANDDEAYSVLQTNDGGYIAAGVTSSFSNGGRDVFLVKTNASGNFMWQKNLGGLSSDGAWDIQHTSDGGFIIAGWTFSHGPGFLGNAWLVKTDSLGNEQWNKAFGGTEVDRAYSVQQTTDGGYILTGYTDSFGAGLYDMLLIKTDNTGNQQWMKTFGGTGRDYGHSVQQTMDGGFIAAGYTLSFGAGGDDMYVVKTDVNGNEQWSNTYGGSSSDVAYGIRETSDGGFIITGHTLSFGAGVHDVWLIRLETIIPVELASFTADVNGNNISLKWMTASEINNAGFDVERASLNPSHGGTSGQWERIGFVEGFGTTTEVISYVYYDNDLDPGFYQYRIKQIDFDGSFEYSPVIEVEVGVPNQFALYQNYPNPFNPSTKISWQSPVSSWQILKVFDVLGNEVAILADEYKPAGNYEVEFNLSAGGQGSASGIYFCRLQTDNYSKTIKMLYLK